MKTIARRSWIDSNRISHKNDIYLVNGQLALADGVSAYAQTIEAVVLTRRGELQLDTEAGIPYFETIFASRNAVGAWAAAVRAAVSALPFVDSILSFDYSFNHAAKTLDYTMRVATDLGVTVASATEGLAL